MRSIHAFLAVVVLLLALVGCGTGTLPARSGASPELQATAFTSTLVAKHSGKCLDIKGGSFRNGSSMEQEGCSGSEAPNFEFLPVAGKSATYLIKNTRTGKCVDVFRAKKDNRAGVIQYSCGEGANQHFQLTDAGGGYYQLKAQHSGKCVDVRWALKKDGTEIIQYSCQSSSVRQKNGNQLWKISTRGSPSGGGEPPSGSDDGNDNSGKPEADAYYVALDGSDGAKGSITAPFRTVQKCASVARAGESCVLRTGTYRETVRPANSGRSGSPITFKPYPGEKVTINGAHKITKWQKHQGNIYKAPVSWDLGVGNNQVFVDGKMMAEARWPNRGADPSRPTFAHTDKVSGGGSSWTLYDNALPGDLTGAYLNVGLGGMLGHAWITQTGQVKSSSGGRLSVTPLSDKFTYNPVARTQYYVWGKRSLLDSPGEWFYDSGEKQVYLWLPDSGNPQQHHVEVKRRQLAFDLKSRSNIEVLDLKLFGATVSTNDQSSDLLLKGLDVRYPSHYLNTPKLPWSRGVKDSGVVLHGRNHTLQDSRIAYSAGNGVTLQGTNHKVENNVIHDVAYAGGDTSAVTMACITNDCKGKSSGHLVQKNTLYNAGRSVLLHRNTKSSRILYNDMSRAGLQMDDLGITYTHGTDGDGTELAYNLIHDNEADNLGLGIYLDEGSHDFLIHHNVVWGVKDALRFNLPSTENLAFNNTLQAERHSISYWSKRGNETMKNTGAYNNLVNKAIRLDYGAVAKNNLETTNPGFVDAGRRDFRLRNTSPAIDKGRVIDGHTRRYAGSAPDVGAFEYGESWKAGSKNSLQGDQAFALSD